MQFVIAIFAFIGLAAAFGLTILTFVICYDQYKWFLPAWILPAFRIELLKGRFKQKKIWGIEETTAYHGPLCLFSDKFDFRLIKEGWPKTQVFPAGHKLKLAAGCYELSVLSPSTLHRTHAFVFPPRVYALAYLGMFLWRAERGNACVLHSGTF